jgi:hypothetical protein
MMNQTMVYFLSLWLLRSKSRSISNGAIQKVISDFPGTMSRSAAPSWDFEWAVVTAGFGMIEGVIIKLEGEPGGAAEF